MAESPILTPRQRHGLPLLASWLFVLLLSGGGLEKPWPGNLFWYAAVFLGAGVLIGLLTPMNGPEDYRGTNCKYLLLPAWLGLLLLSSRGFDLSLSVSDWFFQWMMTNLALGFAAVGGAFVGTALQPFLIRLFPDYLAYLTFPKGETKNSGAQIPAKPSSRSKS